MRYLYRALTVLGSYRAQRVMGIATLVGLAATVVIGLFVVPPDATQGDVQRLMYVHVPTAWVTFLAFGVMFLASVAYLKTRRIQWDRVAAASAEIGVLCCALTIVLGSLWGRPVWGTWWTWDPRLTTTAVLLLIYVGYLSLRKVADSPGPAGQVVGGRRRDRVHRRADRAPVRRVVAVAASAGDGAAAGRADHRQRACWLRCSSRSWPSRWPTAT